MIDLYIKEIAFTTAAIATLMPIFENQIKVNLFKLFPKHKKWIKRIWVGTFILCATGAWWYGIRVITSDEGRANKSEIENNQAKTAALKADSEVIKLLQDQIDCQKMSEMKTDSRHTSDSAYYTRQNDKLADIINGLIYTSKRTLDTSTKTIAEVKKIKTPPIEPVIDLYPPPVIKLNKDSSLHIIINFSPVNNEIAKNIQVYVQFIRNIQGEYLNFGVFVLNNESQIAYQGKNGSWEFIAKAPDHDWFHPPYYVFIKITYTDNNNKEQSPQYNIYSLNNTDIGKDLEPVDDTSEFNKVKNRLELAGLL